MTDFDEKNTGNGNVPEDENLWAGDIYDEADVWAGTAGTAGAAGATDGVAGGEPKGEEAGNEWTAAEAPEEKADDEWAAAEAEEPEQKPEEKPSGSFYGERIKVEKKKKPGGFKRFIAALLIVSIAGGFSIGGGYAVFRNSAETAGTLDAAGADGISIDISKSPARSGMSSVDIVKAVSPAVVNITVKGTGTQTYFGGYQVPYEYAGAGSGFIFGEDDQKVYILTNNHVVADYDEIFVTLDDAENISANIVGKDGDSEIAVLSIKKSDLEAAGVTSVTVATLGNSDSLEVGESVIAIGNSLGLGKVSTGGMISALGKEINIQGVTLEVIQTDAAINAGNSGGALVNSSGEVIGICTAKSSGSMSSTAIEGMGYAIPSNSAVETAKVLLESGSIAKPYLGIMGENVTDELSDLYRLPVGVLIRQVLDGSAAAEGGIEAGDIITEFNGTKIMDMTDLTEALAQTQVGQSVTVRIIRGGNTALEKTVVIQDANNR